eukprot:TRINITY_DN43143_c0_g1_i1.p1 TRINITY_DN43143_c0_g1~~TRINITY_DN43143_c0_g1_i1.p1  ORF type:complete len:423 (+),score=68.05 TRINITY_DN43143_c0_g1_i1:64-1332(+)
MVHFGHFLDSEQSRCSRDSYIGYKILKKQVKKVCAASRAQAVGELSYEADPTSDTDVETEVATPNRIAERGKEEFLCLLQDEIRKLNQFVVQAKSEAQLAPDLEELAIFAETNRTAIRKIVKKFHKKCGPSQELQLQLQSLDNEPFLASLAQELPKARIALQIRLSSAGVCQEEPHGLTQISVQNAFSAGSDAIQVTREELDPSPSTAGSGAMCSVLVRFLCEQILPQRVQERFLFLALLCFGVLLLVASFVLRCVPTIPDSLVSMTCGAGLLMTLTGIVTRMISFCTAVESCTQHSPSLHHCTWQQLEYGNLCVDGFSSNFVVMKVWCEEDGHAVSEIADHVPLGLPQEPIGGAMSGRVWQTSCGCCLKEFDTFDEVTLLPCYHIFCSQCICSWALARAKGSHSCPICRARFRDLNMDQAP